MMNLARNFLICLTLLMLPSCSLISGLLKLPVNILKGAGNIVGIGLTDAPAQPVTGEQDKQASQAVGIGTETVPNKTPVE